MNPLPLGNAQIKVPPHKRGISGVGNKKKKIEINFLIPLAYSYL